ncbi:MAG: hypothetical protein IKQ15_05005 [Kiritimatiellae bacterium]|nr:hypothetical protein [Kiritimatiellia bacterium]
MKDILRTASDLTQSVFDAALSPLRGGNGALGLAFMPLVLGVTATAFVGFLATSTGSAILGELRRRGRLRAPHPESPSLRGTPTADELKADCTRLPRTLHVRLRLGSRLADLEPTLDSANHYRESPTGAKRIQSRGHGLRGYIADNRIAVSYSSLMRYRLLALRLRQLLQLDPRLPLEWLLPGESSDRPLPADLQAPCTTARHRLARLLREHRNFDRLRKHVDAKLGIPELLTVRRTARRAKEAAKSRRWLAKQKPIHCQPVVLGDYTVNATPARLDATASAFARFLREKDLPPKLAAHRDRFLRWLADASGSATAGP